MGGFVQSITDGGVASFVIIGLAIIALAITFERIKTLFFKYRIKSDSFMEQVKGLVLNDQIEDAVTFCGANDKAPLAHVVKSVLERADRDDESIHHGMEIAMSEVIPKMGKRLGYLAMIANVSTLVGLLGTIQGLILSFSAVSFADPSQKQVLLAQGISMAMNTTALGLSVAIPVMIVYAILHARQSRLLEEVSEYSNKMVDLLTTRHYQPFSMGTVFPQDIAGSKVEGKVRMKSRPPAKAA